MKPKLNKMLADELLTDEQIRFYEMTIEDFHNPHSTVYRHSKALIHGYRDLKQKVEEMQKELEQVTNYAKLLESVVGVAQSLKGESK